MPAYIQSRYYRAPEVLLRVRPETLTPKLFEVVGGEEEAGAAIGGTANITAPASAPAADPRLRSQQQGSARQGRYGPEIDIWSLAVMLPELRSGMYDV